MRIPLFVLWFLFAEFSFAQKINDIKYRDGTESYHLISKTDTSYYVNYPNTKKEAFCKLKAGLLHGTYTRWYSNGIKMWSKEMRYGLPEGTSSFFNKKGELLAKLIYAKGVITDTLFLNPEAHIIIGNIYYSSKVYGGMENNDGSSNISENSGPFVNYSMYAVKLDSLKKPQLIDEFKSDLMGEFMISVPHGNIGIYPTSIKISELKEPYSSIPESISMSSNGGWDVKLPIKIKKKETLKLLTLKHYSEAYAP